MAKRVPTLGYRSRTEAILALRIDGKKTQEIADLIGLPRSKITALELHAARAQKRRSAPAMDLPQHLLPRLAPHAISRGMTSKGLAIRLLETVLEEQLVDAVLDDGGAA